MSNQILEKMISFHGSEAVKKKYLKRVIAHRKADQIIKGTYWADGKGCAVGCTIHSNEHAAYETELGIPRSLAYLEDGLFENLPNADAMLWPERFLRAVPIGKDEAWFERVKSHFLRWMLVDEKEGLLTLKAVNEKGAEDVRKAIIGVAALHSHVIRGETVPEGEWDAARAAARDAARAAARDAARDAAWAARIKRESEKLLELLGSVE